MSQFNHLHGIGVCLRCRRWTAQRPTEYDSQFYTCLYCEEWYHLITHARTASIGLGCLILDEFILSWLNEGIVF